MECRNLYMCVNELEKTKVKPIGCSEDKCLVSCDIRKYFAMIYNCVVQIQGLCKSYYFEPDECSKY